MKTLADTSAGPVRRVASTLRPARRELVVAALLGAAATLCAIGLMALSGYLISEASLQPPVLSLTVAIVFVRAFGIGRGFFRYAERLVSHDAVFRALSGLRVQVWERLERLAPHGLAEFRRGDLLARMVTDVDAVQDLGLRIALPAATALVAGGVSVAVAWWLLPAAGAVLLIVLVLGATIVPWATVRGARRAQSATAEAKGELSAQIRELLHGAPDVMATGAGADALARIRASDRRLTELTGRVAGSAGLGAGLGVVLAGLAVIGSLLVAIPAVGDGRLEGVNLAVLVLLPLAAYEAVVGLPAAALALVSVRSSATRLTAILDHPDPVAEPDAPLAVNSGGGHDLVIRGLTVRWADGAPAALASLDLELAAGSRLAVVGPSGSGKTTLVASLLRFVEYTGSVRLAGRELKNLAGEDVRRIVGLCAQDAHIFDSTVAENLRIARPCAAVDELTAVVERVGLAVWLDSLPLGLDTPVGERGSRLSGGQRQRLALARALLADFPILLLDEPTEHLDVEAADALTADVLALTADRSCLLVTHRLSGLDQVDEIVVLRAGEVTERGPHSTLLAQGGWYATAWTREQERALALAQALRTAKT